MPSPESTSAVLRSDLSAVAQEYDAERGAQLFISDLVCPRFDSDKQNGYYPIMRRGDLKKAADVRRNARGGYNRIRSVFGTGNFSCEDKGLEYPLDDIEVRKYKDFFDAEQQATRALRQQILLNREIAAAALYSGAGLTNHHVATAWSTAADADPITDVVNAGNALMDICGIPLAMLDLIIARDAFLEMVACTKFQAKTLYTYPGIQPGILKADQVAQILGCRRVIVAKAGYDSAQEGITESMAQIWTAGQMYLVALAQPGEPLDVPSAARNILWTADSPEMPVVESYRDESVRADIIRMRENSDPVMIGAVDVLAYAFDANAS